MTTNYTKLPKIAANGRKIFHTTIFHTTIFHSMAIKNLPKIGLFGLKINHLATLIVSAPRLSEA
jgi:hypothetical protein